MLHGSWFLLQLYYAISVGGKNRGEAKAEKKVRVSAFFSAKAKPPNGEPGCPRPHDLAAPPGRKV